MPPAVGKMGESEFRNPRVKPVLADVCVGLGEDGD